MDEKNSGKYTLQNSSYGKLGGKFSTTKSFLLFFPDKDIPEVERFKKRKPNDFVSVSGPLLDPMWSRSQTTMDPNESQWITMNPRPQCGHTLDMVALPWAMAFYQKSGIYLQICERFAGFAV